MPDWVTDLLKSPTVVDHKLSTSSAEIAIGDWFCIDVNDTSGDTVTKAVTAALVLAGGPLAMATRASLPGGRVRGMVAGHAPPAVAGLGVGSAQTCRVNPTTGRTERVAGFGPTDYGVGVASTVGGLTIGIANPGQFGATLADFAGTNGGSAYETITALTYTIAENTKVDVTYLVTGKQGSEVSHYERIATYHRLTGGAAALVRDVPTSGLPFEVDSAWDAKINLSGNDLQFQVKANGENPAPAWKVVRLLNVQTLP